MTYPVNYGHGHNESVFPTASSNIPQGYMHTQHPQYYAQPQQPQYYSQQQQQHHYPQQGFHAEHYASPPPQYQAPSQASASSEPAPATWKEGAEKVKKGFSGFFDAIGKTFKKLFSKEGLSPLVGFFSRSFVDVGAEIANQFAKIFIPACTDKNHGLYEATFSTAINEVAALIKSAIPADKPMSSEFSGLFHGIAATIADGVNRFQFAGNENMAARDRQDIAKEKEQLAKERAEFEKMRQQAAFQQGLYV